MAQIFALPVDDERCMYVFNSGMKGGHGLTSSLNDPDCWFHCDDDLLMVGCC
jgi:hypothetical protein